jgi:hypothetical protein
MPHQNRLQAQNSHLLTRPEANFQPSRRRIFGSGSGGGGGTRERERPELRSGMLLSHYRIFFLQSALLSVYFPASFVSNHSATHLKLPPQESKIMRYFISCQLILLVLSFTLLSQPTDPEINYQFINTQQSSTLEKELNQQAAAGWRLLLLPKAYGSDTMGALLGKTETEQKYEYKVLAAKRIGTLENEFTEAVKQGFDFRGIITTERILVGGETLIVLEREQGKSVAQNEYIFLNTKKEATLEKELGTAVSQGYVPKGFTRTEDRSVKQQMFGIMAGSPMELTMILSRNRETPAGEMGQREFKILTTYKIGTLEKEMNQAAKDGYRYYYAAPNTIAIMARDPKVKTAQYEYKLLGTHRVGTMEKEMNEIGATGFAYRATSSGAGGLATIFEKKLQAEAGAKYETKLITKLTDSSTNKSIQEMKKSGFELIDVTNLSTFLLVLQKDTEK